MSVLDVADGCRNLAQRESAVNHRSHLSRFAEFLQHQQVSLVGLHQQVCQFLTANRKQVSTNRGITFSLRRWHAGFPPHLCEPRCPCGTPPGCARSSTCVTNATFRLPGSTSSRRCPSSAFVGAPVGAPRVHSHKRCNPTTPVGLLLIRPQKKRHPNYCTSEVHMTRVTGIGGILFQGQGRTRAAGLV